MYSEGPQRSAGAERPRRGVLWVSVGCMLWCAGQAHAQNPGQPVTQPATAASNVSVDQLMNELRQLRQEVSETRALKEQLNQLQSDMAAMRGTATPSLPSGGMPADAPAAGGVPNGLGGVAGTGPGSSEPDTTEGGAVIPQTNGPDDNFPMKGSYKYHYDAGGPLGGGGYFHVADPDDEFSVNLTNQITVDGTFFDRQNMPTIEQGFNIPFARTYLYGNITKNWRYQIGTQGFLGTFNLLDLFMSYSFGDWMTVRFGKGLAPPLYEYYAFTPALEPVITNSPLFQMAAARPLGVMATGNILDSHVQYWAGVSNSAKSTFFALDRNVNFNGAVDFKPFPRADNTLKGLGGGVGMQTGEQQYALSQGGTGFLNNGEATTNPAWITSSGIPFAVYNPGIRASGFESKISPHIYWFGRFSVLAEYMDFSRVLSDPSTGISGRSTQRAYYVNLSYFLTGERDFAGNGFQAYSTVVPNRPFIPKEGLWGPGAWQLAAQWSELNVGRGDFDRGFIDSTRWTNRLMQGMVGVNWWPNKYTRLSFDYVWSGFNAPIPVNMPNPISSFNTFWMRFAMFF
jgi:phosphate-selective porin OprO and OprP